jgi:hypothetical protein
MSLRGTSSHQLSYCSILLLRLQELGVELNASSRAEAELRHMNEMIQSDAVPEV